MVIAVKEKEQVSELIPDKEAYQTNKRRMAWVLIILMGITTILTLAFPDRLAEAESILMTQYISMCGLVGAYFGFSAMGNKKCQQLKKIKVGTTTKIHLRSHYAENLWPQELQYFCFKKIWKNLPKLTTQY